MNYNNQTEMNDKCCPTSCSKNFEAAGQQIVNNYRCGEKKFSTSDMWAIQKNRKEIFRRY